MGRPHQWYPSGLPFFSDYIKVIVGQRPEEVMLGPSPLAGEGQDEGIPCACTMVRVDIADDLFIMYMDTASKNTMTPCERRRI
jgi:hypothetical protein